MAKKRWSDLSPRTRRLIVIAGAFDAVLKGTALLDLVRRPADQVRGSKPVWLAGIGLTNSVGLLPAAYLVYGRRSA